MTEIVASTQEHLDIEDIDQDLVILKDGGAAMVLQTTSLNFDLLSEPEQDGIIAAYSGLLNSLSFYIQVLLISKRTDVSTYLQLVSQAEQTQQNPLLKEKIKHYKEFVQQLISKNEVLDKQFYIIIPYRLAVIKSKESPLDHLKKSFGFNVTPKRSRRFDKRETIKRAMIDLGPKKDHIIGQLNRCGLKAKQLETQELIKLFYYIYNPDTARSQPLSKDVEEYTTPIVEPDIKM